MKTPILDSLEKYNNENNIRFHMPGHKGESKGYDILNKIKNNLYEFDVTEVDGTDNLHNPEGNIKESQEETAKCYFSGESFYLVNGSTCGIYAMILSVANKGDKIILQRNCHRSVFMAAYIGELNTEYITPTIAEDFSFAASVSVEDVERVIEENKDAKALVITSPTYYGTCADIKAISEICRKNNILLLVDSAHGAHFAFSKLLPNTAIELGADIEVISFHKTLPSMTQTAILNVSKNALEKVDIKKLKFMLSLYQSSSPSYILMASIEAGTCIMKENGKDLLEKVIFYIKDFKEKIKSSDFYSCLDKSYIGGNYIYNIDETRLVISSKLGGVRLSEILREKYSIQVEMADNKNIVIIGTVFDKKEDYEKLYLALKEIEKDYNSIEEVRVIDNNIMDYTYKRKLSIYEGYTLSKAEVSLEDSKDMISGEIVAPYPPGIPVLLPGEVITYDKIRCIKNCKKLGIEINGIEDKTANTIKVINKVD